MKAKVKFINHAIGRVAALTEDGDYSTFEPLGDEVEIGDIVFWATPTPLGHEKIKNLSKNETIEVFFQNHYISKEILPEQLGVR